MNIIKKLTAVCLIIILTLPVEAQLDLSYDNVNKQFSITTPAIKLQKKGNPTPYTRVFLETGNGAFFTFTTNTSDGVPTNQAHPFLQSWHFNPPQPNQEPIHPPIVQLNTYYDTIRIPPLTTSIANFDPQTSTINNPPQNTLLSNQYLKITPSTNTIIPGDMMTVALSYKNTTPADDAVQFDRSILVFYYNGLENPNIFNEVPTGTNAEPYQFGGVSVPALRKHNNETILSIDQVPAKIRQKLTALNPGYNKVVYISVPYDPSIPERNIFLSMAPNSDTSSYTSILSSVKTVLIDYKCNYSDPADCGKDSIITELIEPFTIDFVSRDPNNIFTTPNCFNCRSSLVAPAVNCIGTYKNKPIDYTIQFENIGAGVADSIRITVSIPKGIKFPSLNETTNLFSCSIGRTNIPIYRNGPPALVNVKNMRYCSYYLNAETGQIVFTIKNSNLAGTIESRGDRSRAGKIKFRLKTVSNLSRFPTCMISKVSIVFDRNRPETTSSTIRLDCNNKICPPVYGGPVGN
jgi:hypothetical protein